MTQSSLSCARRYEVSVRRSRKQQQQQQPTTTSPNKAKMDVMDLLLLHFVVHWLSTEVEDLIANYESLLSRHIREQRRLNRSLPDEVKRPSWELFCGKLPALHFRRMFRMKLRDFQNLCKLIRKKIGDQAFCSEECLRENNLIEDDNSTAQKRKIPPFLEKSRLQSPLKCWREALTWIWFPCLVCQRAVYTGSG